MVTRTVAYFTFAIIFCVNMKLCAQAITKEESERAKALLVEFGAHESHFKTFGVICESVITTDDPKGKRVAENQYLYCRDTVNKKARYDAVTTSFSVSLASESESRNTLLRGDATTDWFGNGLRQGGIAKGEDVKSDVPLPKLVMLNPFQAAAVGYSAFAPLRVDVAPDNFAKGLASLKVVSFEEDSRYVGSS